MKNFKYIIVFAILITACKSIKYKDGDRQKFLLEMRSTC